VARWQGGGGKGEPVVPPRVPLVLRQKWIYACAETLIALRD
jgi:hypothetical protein